MLFLWITMDTLYKNGYKTIKYWLNLTHTWLTMTETKTNTAATVQFVSSELLSSLSFSFFCFLLQRYLLLFLFLDYLHLYPSPHLSISLFSCSATLFVSISFSLSIPLHISPHIPFSLFHPPCFLLLPVLSLRLPLSLSPFHRKWFLSQKGG